MFVGPPQRAIQLAGFLQAMDLAQPNVAATFQILDCEPYCTISIVEFAEHLCVLSTGDGSRATRA